jgi:tRNA uridine 5-carboxymethylaminomethyl modification enzyme
MSYCYPNEYEVIVVGGGNAGIEAAAACARMKAKTLLVTHNLDNLGQQSCNPSIGGIGKSHLVKEVDALDGLIAKATDFSGIQFRVLNASKGAAVRATRAQIDRRLYKYQMRTRIEAIENLSLIEEAVDALLLENGKVAGVYLRSGISIKAKAVVLCAGTFLNGKVFIGQTSYLAGRSGDPSSVNLGINLAELGLPKARLKTGTPARLDGRTIDFSKCERQLGDSEPVPVFSYMGSPEDHPQQVPCWITDTNQTTHDFIRKGLDRSPLFTGVIEGIGPRYCPSIEDKIHKFASKNSHHVFLEPEGLNTYEYYPNGISTSLPYDVQVNFIHSIKGLENVHIIRPGYAIEYDYYDPTHLKDNLESKEFDNLFLAGQVNGTTGYEEAGGQGAIAGINAHINCHGGEEFTLARDEAYIGVLIDDLVTKGVDEPYRMFTSRAEYRILLRMDDADMRLTERAYKLGLAKEDRYRLMKSKKEAVEQIISFARNYSMKPALINDALEKIGTTPLRQGCKLIEILNRPQVTIENIAEHVPAFQRELEKATSANQDRKEEILEAAEILIKYQGYIDRERMIAEKLARLESIKIKGKFDYSSIQSLSTEARQKLTKIDPETIAQASRIPGVSPSDINVLLVLSGR